MITISYRPKYDSHSTDTNTHTHKEKKTSTMSFRYNKSELITTSRNQPFPMANCGIGVLFALPKRTCDNIENLIFKNSVPQRTKHALNSEYCGTRYMCDMRHILPPYENNFL